MEEKLLDKQAPVDTFASTSTKTELTKEDKQNIIKKAKTTAENVQNLEVNLEFNEKWRGWEYDIEFNIGNKKYECVINAIYGTIIKFIS